MRKERIIYSWPNEMPGGGIVHAAIVRRKRRIPALEDWTMGRYDWNDFYRDINLLASQVKESKYNPTMLVAVARGGWIPTRFLSDALGVKRISSIGIAYEDSTREAFVLYSTPYPIHSYERLLVIEDFLESGRCLSHAISTLEQSGAAVRSATLYHSEKSGLRSDYSLGSKHEPPIFPWERSPV